jgi:hypothetical protein
MLGVVSHWHLFPYLSIFADFSSFPFLGWHFSVHSCYWGHRTFSGAATITFHHEHSKRSAQAQSPDEGMRMSCIVLFGPGPHGLLFTLISFLNVNTSFVHNNVISFCF